MSLLDNNIDLLTIDLLSKMHADGVCKKVRSRRQECLANKEMYDFAFLSRLN